MPAPRNAQQMAEKDMYRTYVVNGVMYVPHYVKHNVYVGPGYDELRHTKTYTAADLVLGGALPRNEYLFTRARGDANAKR